MASLKILFFDGAYILHMAGVIRTTYFAVIWATTSSAHNGFHITAKHIRYTALPCWREHT